MIQRDFLSVSQLAELINNTISREPALKSLWVKGEISNFKRHSSGHLYFSIKDKGAVVRAVMFRGNADKLKIKPQDGMSCFFHGYVSLYIRETQLQFYVEDIENEGVGAESLALDELRRRLTAQGYFDPSRKKATPRLPVAVGVISSPTGAVIQDIKNVIGRRYPGMPILLYPSAVQGRDAVNDLLNGLRVMEKAMVSVIILARGGGSAEDLSAFNREELVKAIFSCSKPVISAVGHETDITLADLAADLRASTPSMAAELAVPEKAELLAVIQSFNERLGASVIKELKTQTERLNKTRQSYVYTDPAKVFEPGFARLRQLAGAYVFTQPQRLLDLHRDRLSRSREKISDNARSFLTGSENRLKQALIRIEALSPLATLARGYAICADERGKVLLESSQVEAGQEIRVTLSKGSLAASVTKLM